MAEDKGNVINDVNTTVDPTELALKIYAETLEAFTRTTVMESRVMKKTITSGKSSQFIVVGKANGLVAETDNTILRHDGKSGLVTVSDTPFSERTIVIDYPIYTAKRLDDWQEQMAHYQTRSLITNYMGEDLAIQLDVNLMSLINSGAKYGYNTVTNDASLNLPSTGFTATAVVAASATPKETGVQLMYSLYELRASIRGTDYHGEIAAFVDPTYYDALVLSEILVNSDVTTQNGGLDSGRIGMVGGMMVIETNSIGAANDLAVAGVNGQSGSLQVAYAADTSAANNVAYVMGTDAIGLLSLIGLVTDNDKETDRLGATLMTAKYAYGANVLRPELCGRVQFTTT